MNWYSIASPGSSIAGKNSKLHIIPFLFLLLSNNLAWQAQLVAKRWAASEGNRNLALSMSCFPFGRIILELCTDLMFFKCLVFLGLICS